MAKQIINIGTSPNSKDGDIIRDAFNKANQNFTEIYDALTDGVNLAQVNSDWNAVSGVARILNKPAIPTDVSDLTDTTSLLGQTDRLVSGSQTLILNSTGKLTMPDGLTIDNSSIGYTTSDTITQETPGGTVSQTTSYQNQIIIDTTDAIHIANVLSQTVNDGVTTVTDSTGSTIDVDGTGVYIKKYAEPYGPNNSSYFQLKTSNSGAIIEGVNEDLAGNTYGRVTVAQGVVAINAAAGGIDKEWSFDFDGNLTVPEAASITGTNDLYIKSLVNGNSSGLYLNGNSLVGSAILYANGVATIRADNNGTPKDWSFSKNATLTTPLLLPKTFTAVLDSMHYSGEGSITLEDTPWEYGVAFQVGMDGVVQTTIDNPVRLVNPGYASGYQFTFVEADHGIPGYTFTLTLNDVADGGPAGWTANPAVTQPPEYPSTVASSGAIKLTSSDKSFVFGTDGNLHLPGSIIFPYGAARIYGNTDIVGLLANPNIGAGLEIAAGSTVNLFNEGNVIISANVNQVSGQKDWTFKNDGELQLPSDGSIKQNFSWTRTTSPSVTAATPTIVWTSTVDYISSAKLTIQVEGNETGDDSGWHSQTCEAIVSCRGYASAFGGPGGDPQMIVYGVVHTSVNPLVTFTVQRNPTTKVVEIVGTPTAASNGGASLRIHSVEMSTRD